MYNFLSAALREITNPTFIIQRMKPRAHIIIIKNGARRMNVCGELFNSLWNGEHIFVTVYALPRVGFILNIGGHNALAEAAALATPLFRAPNHINKPTLCCGFFRSGIGSSDRRQYLETSGSKCRVHPRTGHEGPGGNSGIDLLFL